MKKMLKLNYNLIYSEEKYPDLPNDFYENCF